jgi:putative ABC transport system permease protein
MVGPTEIAFIAVRALRLNLMRSILTMLGIVIGVAAVIAIVSIAQGAQQQVSDQIKSMGINTIIVSPDTPVTQTGGGPPHTLNSLDAEAVMKRCSAVTAAAPTWNQSAKVIFGNRNHQTSITGTTGDYLVARKWSVRSGRFFSPDEEAMAAKVCVIGNTVWEKLFAKKYAIGKILRIGDTPCRVVGVLESKGRLAKGDDTDDVILIPLKTAQWRLFGATYPDEIHQIFVHAKDTSLIPTAEKQIQDLLTRRHKITRKQDKDFSISNMKEILDANKETMNIMTALLAAITSISLVVGGIGIMNIMLVTVTERTREIGIRMAVGAQPLDIMVQFVIEAVALSMTGGMLGFLVGIVGSYAFSYFSGWSIVISPLAVFAAVGSSAVVGISFGLYPALKASRLEPIQALRYE